MTARLPLRSNWKGDVFVWLIVLPFTASEFLEFYFHGDNRYENMLPSVDIMWTKSGIGVLECVQECSHVSGCLSVVYGNMTCYGFSNRIHSGVPTTSHANYKYFESKGSHGNVAEKRMVYQSSTVSMPMYGTYTADKAVDGVRDPRPFIPHDSCALVAIGAAIWWQVYMAQQYVITDVAILARNSNPEESESINIDVGSPSPFALCAATAVGDGWINSFRTFTCDVPLYGKVVRITKTDLTHYLCLCEVEVYAMNLN